MNEYDMTVMIVLIVMVSVVLMARYKHKYGKDGDDTQRVENGDVKRLSEEVTYLRDRVKVLERIAVEKEDSLTRQIEQLRDR